MTVTSAEIDAAYDALAAWVTEVETALASDDVDEIERVASAVPPLPTLSDVHGLSGERAAGLGELAARVAVLTVSLSVRRGQLEAEIVNTDDDRRDTKARAKAHHQYISHGEG